MLFALATKIASIRIFLVVMLMLTASMAKAQDESAPNEPALDDFQFECIPAIKIVADLGYCFGFTVTYFEALEATDILAQISAQGIEDSVSDAHLQCYPTDFAKQKQLGTIAFSSYVNLSDDTLLRRTAADCRVLMEYYSNQLQANQTKADQTQTDNAAAD